MDTGTRIKVSGRRFSRALLEERRSRGWTQEHLASQAGISRQAVSLIEAGGGVTLDVAASLARALKLNLTDMI